jgi:hypothetical protein
LRRGLPFQANHRAVWCGSILRDDLIVNTAQGFPLCLLFSYLSYSETRTMNFEKEIEIILRSRRPDSDMLNVIEVLGYQQDNFQRAFDIALEMDNQSLVKLLYSNFNAGKVVVEFTLIGKAASRR